MNEFLEDYVRRHPDEATFVRYLRGRVALAQRGLALWGWLSATATTEREACLDSLGTSRVDTVLRAMLRRVDRTGLRPAGVSATIARLGRTTANALRL